MQMKSWDDVKDTTISLTTLKNFCLDEMKKLEDDFSTYRAAQVQKAIDSGTSTNYAEHQYVALRYVEFCDHIDYPTLTWQYLPAGDWLPMTFRLQGDGTVVDLNFFYWELSFFEQKWRVAVMKAEIRAQELRAIMRSISTLERQLAEVKNEFRYYKMGAERHFADDVALLD